MKGQSWKHRRRLIYASYVLATLMIVFAMAVYRTDTSVASQLIVGGVSLISIILTAYTAFATLDDKWHFPSGFQNENPDSVLENHMPVYDDSVIGELFPEGFGGEDDAL